MQSNIQQIIKMAKIVQAVIDRSWIPEAYQGNRYFSQADLWIYIPHYDVKLCEECGQFALGVPFISGRQLRSSFPDMEIVDENTINANVHPNCRCQLIREGTESPKDVLTKEEVKQAFITGEI